MKVLETKPVPIKSLKPFPGNPRRGDVGVIRESLRTNGQYRPIVVQASTKFVLAGNHTRLAALAEGWPEILATFVDCTDEEAKRIVAVDNRSNDVAGYDDAALVELLQGMDDLTGSGYNNDDLDRLLTQLAPPDPDPEPEDVDDSNVVTQAGDVWHLGPHRVVCGDATQVLESTCNDLDPATTLLITSPPYAGASMWNENDERGLTDNIKRLQGLGETVFDIACRVAKVICWNIADIPIGKGHLYWSSHDLVKWANERACIVRPIIWDKGVTDPIPPPSYARRPAMPHLQWEWIFVCYVNGRKLRDKRVNLVGDEGTWNLRPVWTMGPAKKSERGHIAPFPDELVARCLRLFSLTGDDVVDPFLGSGTSLLVAHRLGRICRGVELEPKYVDLTLKRWQSATGALPVLERTGEEVSFV